MDEKQGMQMTNWINKSNTTRKIIPSVYADNELMIYKEISMQSSNKNESDIIKKHPIINKILQIVFFFFVIPDFKDFAHPHI